MVFIPLPAWTVTLRAASARRSIRQWSRQAATGEGVASESSPTPCRPHQAAKALIHRRWKSADRAADPRPRHRSRNAAISRVHGRSRLSSAAPLFPHDRRRQARAFSLHLSALPPAHASLRARKKAACAGGRWGSWLYEAPFGESSAGERAAEDGCSVPGLPNITSRVGPGPGAARRRLGTQVARRVLQKPGPLGYHLPQLVQPGSQAPGGLACGIVQPGLHHPLADLLRPPQKLLVELPQ